MRDFLSGCPVRELLSGVTDKLSLRCGERAFEPATTFDSRARRSSQVKVQTHAAFLAPPFAPERCAVPIREEDPQPDLQGSCFSAKRAWSVVGLAFGSIAVPLAATGAALGATAGVAKRGAPLETERVLPATDAPESGERRIKLTIRDEEGRILRAADRLDKPFSIEAEIRGWSGFRASLSMDRIPIAGVRLDFQKAFLRATVPIAAAPPDGSHLVSLDLHAADGREAPPPLAIEVTTTFGEPFPRYDGASTVSITFETNNVGFLHPDDLLSFGPFAVERELVQTIVGVARETDTDPALMMTIAEKESGFRPSIEAATSTAAGLYQFIEQTWFSIIAHSGREFGLQREADQLVYDPIGEKYLVLDRSLCTRPQDHLCELLSAEDAARFTSALADDPNQSAAKLLPQAAEEHRDLFYSTFRKKRRSRSVGAVYSKFLQSISSKSEQQRILQLRADPRLSALLATELWKRDCGEIAQAIGRPVTGPETYLCHFMGVNGAVRFLRGLADDPNQSAAKLMPSAAKANKPIFYEGSGRKRRSRSVAAVYQYLIGMMTSRLDRYRDVERRSFEATPVSRSST
jgi:hypothetical protein